MKQNDQKLLLGAGALVLAYFGIIKPILVKVGIFKSADEKKSEKQLQDLINQESATVTTSKKPTKSDFEWRQIADQIYSDLKYSALDDNKRDATYQSCRVKNDADLIKLISFFGKRQEYAFGLPIGAVQSLFEFLRSNLSSSQISTINTNWINKKIKYRL
jgi:hypothetical protein